MLASREAAQAFADGEKRTKAMRDAAWAAQRAAQESRDAGQTAASEAARAALATASAGYLHPLATATQVRHILGSAATPHEHSSSPRVTTPPSGTPTSSRHWLRQRVATPL